MPAGMPAGIKIKSTFAGAMPAPFQINTEL